ncbi:hypothetical protein [Rossellomorea aquimaris]|uniref:hypothetical protein n=1 Tax=Rossellomorea aquimaris TaxID=189382 RepID=UPI0011E915C4|nr:hypothetical protein [Rossellomorea aquimaris]TYS91897.1 hypothetical protein FZC88_07120 [Rossellomorea aquimaris]
MAVVTNGYSAKTAERYLIDAGAVYKNLEFDDVTGDFTGELLGATSGGNEFALSQETRAIEVDGVRGRAKGNTILVSEEPQLTVNLKELTANNLALAIAGSDVDTTDTNYDIITGKGKIDIDDYLDNVALVGRITGSDKPIVVVIHNAISVEGLTITTEDDNEAIVPMVFMGHYDGADIETPPYTIYFPKEVV